MFGQVGAIYRASKKQRDINWFTHRVCRPPAAVIVWALRGTRITPNQVSFLSTFVCLGACAMFVTLPDWWGAVAAAAVFELSFVLDCADGQLARLRGSASLLGHLLDFLMDEIKAFFVFAAIAVRLWRFEDDITYLIAGLAGLAVIASGISITSFMRRPEYGAAGDWTPDGQPHERKQRAGLVGAAIGAFEYAARFVVHYPQWIWAVAIFDRMDIYLWAYGGVNVLYLGYTSLAVLARLGRFEPSP